MLAGCDRTGDNWWARLVAILLKDRTRERLGRDVKLDGVLRGGGDEEKLDRVLRVENNTVEADFDMVEVGRCGSHRLVVLAGGTVAESG